MKKAVAIITARGGSKRIPRKNIKEFCEKPIIAYSIEAALNSGCFDVVMVSTDDVEIASIAKQYGAQVPFMRSENTSNDYATTAEVVEEVLDNFEKEGSVFDAFCCIYPTAPFVTSERLAESMRMLEEEQVDGVVPVVHFSFPPMRGFVCKEGEIQYAYPEYALTRSQDLEPMYHDAGQFYSIKTQAFKREQKMIPKHTRALILSEMEVQDIDNEVDWRMAELKYHFMAKEQR